MKLTARDVPWSSVVGKSVVLLDERGAVLAILGIRVPNPNFPLRETAEEVAEVVIRAINRRQK